MHEPETYVFCTESGVVCICRDPRGKKKKKKYHVTMDRVRCKLLAVWKTCVQTDWQTGCGGAISGVELEDRAARDERRRVTGPAVTLFKTLSPSPFFIPPPPLPSALPPLPKTTVPLVCRTLRRKRWILLLFFFKGILHWIIWKVTTDSYGNPELKLTS